MAVIRELSIHGHGTQAAGDSTPVALPACDTSGTIGKLDFNRPAGIAECVW